MRILLVSVTAAFTAFTAWLVPLFYLLLRPGRDAVDAGAAPITPRT